MPNTVSNVVAGRPLSTGGILVAPMATALPTNVSTALNAAFKAVGYIGDDGLQQSIERNVDKIKAWGGDTIKVVQSDFSVSFSFTLAEALNADGLKAAFGDTNVTTTPATASTGTLQAIKVNGLTLPHKEWVFEIVDGVSKMRIVVPDGQINTIGDITYSDSTVVAYEVTLEAFADASGNQAYIYTDDGKFS